MRGALHERRTTAIIRWPVVVVVLLVVFLELVFYLVLRWILWLAEKIFVSPARRKRLRMMGAAKTYEEWRAAALEADIIDQKQKWKELDRSDFYDCEMLRRNLATLQALRSLNDWKGLAAALLRMAHKNLGGIHNEHLYSRSHIGTKVLIENFVAEFQASLRFLCDHPRMPQSQKSKFFRKAEQSYGKSALCLSGGGGQGYYHVGVVRALLERNLLPTVISGTSAGALIGSIVATHTDKELLETYLTPELARHMTACEGSLLQKAWRFLKTGVAFDAECWLQKTRELVGDYTFEEAYVRTGRVFNVTITSSNRHAPSKILNYITAPHVVVYSAVVASAAIPGLLAPIELLIKDENGNVEPYHVEGLKWTDGSLKTDLPFNSLSHLFNVNFFVVSQVNPHIIPFFFDRTGSAGQPVGGRNRGGFWIAALETLLKQDMKKWLTVLRDLDLSPQILGHDWSLVFLQEFVGSVTIVPSPRLDDYVNIVTDPTPARMKQYIERGQVNTWTKSTMIEMTYKIENLVEELSLRVNNGNGLFEALHEQRKNEESARRLAAGAAPVHVDQSVRPVGLARRMTVH